MNTPILSLCLPTNGIIEWVFPVLESIYAQSTDDSVFEVVVTNNGSNEEFHQRMEEYAKKHNNLIYQKTEAFMFHNQLEALKLASGCYLKLMNHRSVLTEGALEKMLKIVEDNSERKPVIYFSNGVLKNDYVLQSFDLFVRELGEFASWTTGVGIWKSDYEQIPSDVKIDKISPHSCILFANRDREEYKIYNFKFAEEIENNHSRKGTYDLFKAFAVEELAITQNLFIDGNISASTLKKVKNDYRRLVSGFYWRFCIRKAPCSYDLRGFDDAMGIYFSKVDIIARAYMIGVKNILKRLGKFK